jgi:serine/threonine protein kinase
VSLLKFKRVLENEVALLAQMDHPGVIKLHEYNLIGELVVKPCGKCIQIYFIVLELVDQVDLFSVIENGAFKERVARFFFSQLCEGVSYLHEVAGVAHRDLKPENLLLNSNL